MKSFHKITFRANIIREYSAIPEVDQLGEHNCTMELYTEDGTISYDGSGTIEWIVGENNQEVVHIGVWWQQLRLTDYDGIMGYLPVESKPLFEKAGLIVGDRFFPEKKSDISMEVLPADKNVVMLKRDAEFTAYHEMVALSERNLLSIELIKAIGGIHNVDALEIAKRKKLCFYEKVKKVEDDGFEYECTKCDAKSSEVCRCGEDEDYDHPNVQSEGQGRDEIHI